jgi:hypothetical protein
MTTVEARGLVKIDIRATDDDTVALLLTDTTGVTSGYLVGPEGLNKLLLPLLGLATQWAEKSDLKVESLTGPQSALPAHHISIERGRDATESALRIFVGKVELTFMIPLETVLSAFEKLVRQITPGQTH